MRRDHPQSEPSSVLQYILGAARATWSSVPSSGSDIGFRLCLSLVRYPRAADPMRAPSGDLHNAAMENQQVDRH